jgi:hypothetical protein
MAKKEDPLVGARDKISRSGKGKVAARQGPMGPAKNSKRQKLLAPIAKAAGKQHAKSGR